MTPITVADFAAARRQLAPAGMARLVANIEAWYRRSLGVTGWQDDDVVWALYNPAEQTAAERAGIKVIRMCIAYREATDGRDGWLGMLAIALAEADPLRVEGAVVADRRKRGGETVAAQNREQAVDRNARIVKAARAILRDDPGMTYKELARRLEERDGTLGAFVTILKKLPRLLARK